MAFLTLKHAPGDWQSAGEDSYTFPLRETSRTMPRSRYAKLKRVVTANDLCNEDNLVFTGLDGSVTYLNSSRAVRQQRLWRLLIHVSLAILVWCAVRSVARDSPAVFCLGLSRGKLRDSHQSELSSLLMLLLVLPGCDTSRNDDRRRRMQIGSYLPRRADVPVVSCIVRFNHAGVVKTRKVMELVALEQGAVLRHQRVVRAGEAVRREARI
jgi:hypothetical protein